MPIYDYRCPACAVTFETLVRSGTLPACPQCGSTALERAVPLIAPQGRSKAVISAARRQAARAGHFSNYGKTERGKLR